MDYISILLTQDGMFCLAPAWTVTAGDIVSLPDLLSGGDKRSEVISVVTVRQGHDFITMLEKYIGFPLPKITAKYRKSEVEWDEPVQE